MCDNMEETLLSENGQVLQNHDMSLHIDYYFQSNLLSLSICTGQDYKYCDNQYKSRSIVPLLFILTVDCQIVLLSIKSVIRYVAFDMILH